MERSNWIEDVKVKNNKKQIKNMHNRQKYQFKNVKKVDYGYNCLNKNWHVPILGVYYNCKYWT